MSEWLSFEGQGEPLVRGKLGYTIMGLWDDISTVFRTSGANRVDGECNEHPVNLALMRVPVLDGLFLWAGQIKLDQVRIAPFERIEVRLRPAPDDLVEMPDDMAARFCRLEVLEAWEDLTPDKRRGLINKISTAKAFPTREKRIGALAAHLREGTACTASRLRPLS